MACPQPKHHTRISNELLEALTRFQIPSVNALRVVLWVMRKTYGWQKKFTEVPAMTDLAKELGMSRSSVHLAIQVLIEANVLAKDDAGRLSVQKDYELWTVQPAGRKQAKSSSGLTKSSSGLTKSSSGLDTYKEKERKERKERRIVAQGAPLDKVISKPLSKVQEIVELYKFLKMIGYKKIQDQVTRAEFMVKLTEIHAAWDKANFAIYLRSASKLLASFSGDLDAAKVYLTTKASEWDEAGLESWELHGVARDSVNFAAKEKTKDAANDDRRALPFRPELEGSVGTVDHLGHDREQGSRRRFTPSRELIDEAIERFGPEDE